MIPEVMFNYDILDNISDDTSGHDDVEFDNDVDNDEGKNSG